VSFFKKIPGFFSKLFGKAPSALQTISTTIKLIGPGIASLYALVSKDPADAAEAQNVTAEVETDLAAMQTVIAQSHNSADANTYAKLETLANALKGNLQELLTAGHIKNPDTVNKVTAIVNLSIGELDAVLDLLAQNKQPDEQNKQAAAA